MFKNIIVLFSLSINFVSIEMHAQTEIYKAQIKNLIALSKEFKENLSAVEKKSDSFKEGDCAHFVYTALSSKFKNVVKERRNIKDQLKSLKVQKESDLKQWAELADRAQKNASSMKQLNPDLDFLKRFQSKNN